MEFSPVDYCTKTIVEISRLHEASGKAFHIYNHKTIFMKQVLDILESAGISVSILDDAEYLDYIKKANEDPTKKEFFSWIINDYRNSEVFEEVSATGINSDITKEYCRIIGTEWPDITEEYILKVTRHMILRGFLK